MNYKSESTVIQTHRFPEQEVEVEGGVFTIKASFSRENLIELANFKQFELVLKVPFRPTNKE